MTPPLQKAPLPDQSGGGPGVSAAPVSILRKRREFLACARARRAHATGMVVQARRRAPGEAEGIRVGFPCSKKIGKEVVRNRTRRRLREAARAVLPRLGRAGWDYVLIGRPEVTVARPFADLVGDLECALRRLHGKAEA